jgi:hypothetical protein
MARALSASSRSVWGEEAPELRATNEGLAADDFVAGFLNGEVYIDRKSDFPCNGEGARVVNVNAAVSLLVISASCSRTMLASCSAYCL